jgi:regulator of sirC expression with transglutaminase-like and TPR domain
VAPDFAELAARPDPPLDELALALAAAFRPTRRDEALEALERLGGELAAVGASAPDEQAEACRTILGGRHGFAGDRRHYDHPRNSMLDLVLEHRRGLPILLAVVYAETARRAGYELDPVGLPGHFVVAHFGADPAIVLDPFSGGRDVTREVDHAVLRAWSPHEVALRMLTNLVRSFAVRGDLGRAITAAELRLVLPVPAETQAALGIEARALRARLN